MLRLNFPTSRILILIVCSLLLQAQSHAQPRGDEPASIGILLDSSKSMLGTRKELVAALLTLVRSSNPQDEFFVVNFSDQPYLDQDFTTAYDLIERALEKPAAGRGTAFYDAVEYSSVHLRDAAKFNKRARVVVSDGEDNESHINSEKMLKELQQPGGPVVYCIVLGDSGRHGSTILGKIARKTSGNVYRIKKSTQVEEIATQIAEQIRK